MGLFSSKKKVSIDDIAMQTMLAAVDAVGKVEKFEDVDDKTTMAISLGYFYGFLKLHLNSITKLNIANDVIERSLANLENATKGKTEFANISSAVRCSSNNALASMREELTKRSDNPFVGVAVDYLKELYNNPPSIDFAQTIIAMENMKLLYAKAMDLTRNVKIAV